MRTLVDIPEADLKVLNRLSRMGNVSRAELVRRAIRTYLEPHKGADLEGAFGLWKDHAEDGMVYQERLRSEW